MERLARMTRYLLNILIPAAGWILLCTLGPRLLRFFLPFVVGWILAMIANPLVRFLERRLRIARGHSSVLIIVLVLAALVGLIYLVSARVITECADLIRDLPELFDTAKEEVMKALDRIDDLFVYFPSGVQDFFDQFGENAGVTWYSQPLNLQYTQPLFGYNDFKWRKLISPKEYEKARRTYLERMEDVNISAVTLYFNLLLADRNLETARTNYANTSAMLDVARRRLELGSVTRDEYLQLELRMLNDSLSISENEVELRKARMELNSLLGYDESYEISPVLDSSLPDITMDYELVLDKSGTNSSFNLDGDINLLNAEAAIAQAKADRGITMSLNATFGLSASGSELAAVYRNPLHQEVVGLNFSVPIFDWGEGKGKVKKAEAAAEVVKATVAQERNDRRIALFTAVGQFNNQRQICLVSQRAEDIARERYALVMENFRGGTATVTDLNTARSESDTAIQNYISDLSNFWIYYYNLRKYTLYDFMLERDLEVVPEELTM